jgi:hypothetical protein
VRDDARVRRQKFRVDFSTKGENARAGPKKKRRWLKRNEAEKKES